MIADKTLEALKAWIDSNAAVFPILADLTIVLRDSDAVKTYPLLTLNDTATQEHPTLYGVQSPLTVEAVLDSVPNSENYAAEATNTATHQTYSEALECVLGDYPAAKLFMDARSGIIVWDVRSLTATSEESDGYRQTNFELQITCANQ